MEYVIIAIVCVAAVAYLIFRFRGVFQGKQDMGCAGCDKACGDVNESCSEKGQNAR